MGQQDRQHQLGPPHLFCQYPLHLLLVQWVPRIRLYQVNRLCHDHPVPQLCHANRDFLFLRAARDCQDNLFHLFHLVVQSTKASEPKIINIIR